MHIKHASARKLDKFLSAWHHCSSWDFKIWFLWIHVHQFRSSLIYSICTIWLLEHLWKAHMNNIWAYSRCICLKIHEKGNKLLILLYFGWFVGAFCCNSDLPVSVEEGFAPSAELGDNVERSDTGFCSSNWTFWLWFLSWVCLLCAVSVENCLRVAPCEASL